MTIEELLARESIRDTMAKYNTSGDRLKVADYVACFTEDGIMESDGVAEDKAFRYAGRPEILAWQSRWLRRGGCLHFRVPDQFDHAYRAVARSRRDARRDGWPAGCAASGALVVFTCRGSSS